MQGIGIGLVKSNLIAKKFNGEIDFTSKYKHGSIFFFSFQIENLNEEELCSYHEKSVEIC